MLKTSYVKQCRFITANKKIFVRQIIFCLIGLCFLAIQSKAQDTITGAFLGKVSNNVTGDTIAGSSVEITNEQTGVTYKLRTNSKGLFYQGLLAPGWYLIKVSIAGFDTRTLRRRLEISLAGEVVPVPVKLDPVGAGSVGQTIEEGDIRVEMNMTDARSDESAKEDEITTLPVGASTVTQSFDELALLAEGVAPPPQTIGDAAGPGVGPGVGSAGQFAVNGLRSRGNNFTVDGSDNNDEDIGVRRQGFVALISQPLESIKEYQIITLLAPAQFGRNIGAQVNAVSKSGGNKLNGSLSGAFNSNLLNARDFFDTTGGNAVSPLKTAAGQPVLLDNQPLTVRNQSGGENSFTYAQMSATLGGAILPRRLFYFVSAEFQKINAVREKNFVVPTVEQRGVFGTGASGIFINPFTNPVVDTRAIPVTLQGSALFSLFPFPNNPTGVYGANTFTQILPAGGRGTILSGRLDENFKIRERRQSATARYNFTDDERSIPAVGEAVFSTLLARVRTHNFSFFFNSQLNAPNSNRLFFNQIRLSYGRTRLNFTEVRDREFLIPSDEFPNTPFLLNAPLRLNVTQPAAAGQPNTGAVLYRSVFAPVGGTRDSTTESQIDLLGQVNLAGFSSLGADVYNFPQLRVNNTYQFADELTMRLDNHSLAFGADFRRTDLNSNLPRLARPLVNFNGTPRLIFENGDFRFPTAADPNPIIRAEDLAALGAASDFLLTFNVDRADSKANLRYYQLNFYGQDTWRIRPNFSISFGLRYEYNTPVKEVNNLIEQTFTDSRLSFIPGLSPFIDGRTRLYEPDGNNFAPRFGAAYSPNFLGRKRTGVFRAGFGIFYDQILGAVVNQSRNVFPTFFTFNFGGQAGNTPNFLQYYNPTGQSFLDNFGNFVPLRAPGTINGFNRAISFNRLFEEIRLGFPNAVNATLPSRQLDMPTAYHVSFVFEQQLNSNFVVSAGYVRTAGQKLLRFTTPNLGSSLTVAPTALQLFQIPTDNQIIPFFLAQGLVRIPNRPVNNVGAVNLFETTAASTYNALQAHLQGRFIRVFDFQISYTFSKVTDDVSDVFDLAGAFVLPQNSLTFAGERAPANFDVRHRFTYNLIYNFPKQNNNFFGRLTDNLQIAGIGRFQTGQPFTVNSIIDVNLDGNLTDRLNTTQGIEVTGSGRQPLRLTTDNPLALLAPFGQDGRINRNSFRAGNILELDLSFIKRINFGSRYLLLRTDIFNVINRANFGVPVRLLEAPGFGQAVNTITPGRRVQLSLKYEF